MGIIWLIIWSIMPFKVGKMTIETNETLPFETAKEGENRLLAAMNKWLIAHEDAQIEGAFC